MSSRPAHAAKGPGNPIVRAVSALGNAVYRRADAMSGTVKFLGGSIYLFSDTMRWVGRALVSKRVKIGRANLWAQCVRVGIRSIPIVMIVQVFIGIILALQIAPILESYGQLQRVADVVGIAMFRELGPLLAGIVLSGFAGASIAAELGTMVEGEEIKALRACALNPVHFLVVPRFLATVLMLSLLTVISDVVGVFGGLFTATTILRIEATQYLSFTQAALLPKDFVTGVVKAAVFGVMISIIACYEGLNVSGGAEGVGRATTQTVVKSIVALISADVIFTALFYAFDL